MMESGNKTNSLEYRLSVENKKETEIVIEFVSMLDRDSRKELLKILQAALLLKILNVNKDV